MSAKVLFNVLILIAYECVLLAAANTTDTSLIQNPPLNVEVLTPDTNETATSLVSNQETDADLKKILFTEATKIHECVITNATSTRNTTKYNNKPLWTVVILKEEIFLNKTLNIQLCSGSLIHPQVVLTAAHCIFKNPLQNLKVRAGASNRRSNGNSQLYQESQIQSSAVMKAYDFRKPKQDIALLFLKNRFKISPYVKTVCIPPANVNLDLDYVRCFTAGWTRQSHTLSGHRNFKKLNVTVIPKENCQKAMQLTGLGEDFILRKSFICTDGEFHKTAFNANGGAPLVCPICEIPGRMIQIGLDSWGFSDTPLPEVFASVSKARRWIWEEFKKQGLQLSSCGIKWNKQQKHLKITAR